MPHPTWMVLTFYQKKFRAPNIKIIEALSATGLRSIRYAKEIPDIKYVPPFTLIVPVVPAHSV